MPYFHSSRRGPALLTVTLLLAACGGGTDEESVGEGPASTVVETTTTAETTTTVETTTTEAPVVLDEATIRATLAGEPEVRRERSPGSGFVTGTIDADGRIVAVSENGSLGVLDSSTLVTESVGGFVVGVYPTDDGDTWLVGGSRSRPVVEAGDPEDGWYTASRFSEARDALLFETDDLTADAVIVGDPTLVMFSDAEFDTTMLTIADGADPALVPLTPSEGISRFQIWSGLRLADGTLLFSGLVDTSDFGTGDVVGATFEVTLDGRVELRATVEDSGLVRWIAEPTPGLLLAADLVEGDDGRPTSRMMVSNDRGATWTEIPATLEGGDLIQSFAVTDERIVLFGSRNRGELILEFPVVAG